MLIASNTDCVSVFCLSVSPSRDESRNDVHRSGIMVQLGRFRAAHAATFHIVRYLLIGERLDRSVLLAGVGHVARRMRSQIQAARKLQCRMSRIAS